MASRLFVYDDELTSIANAIREKNGTSEELAFPAGFVSSIQAIKAGNGSNITVVGGTTQPENPEINTIWVNTDMEIGKWYATPDEPTSPEEGDVWMHLKASSFSVEIAEENSMVIEISNVYQYSSGEWVQRSIQIFRNGSWEEASLNELTLLDTDGWRYGLSFRSITDYADITIYNDSYPVTLFMYRYSGAYLPDVDLTDYDVLEFDAEGGANEKTYFSVTDGTTYGSVSSTSAGTLVYQRIDGAFSRNYYSLDISSITGTHNIMIAGWGLSEDVYIYSIKLLKNGA